MGRNGQSAGVASLPLLLSIDMVAEQIGVHRATAWAMVSRGEIRSVKVSPRVRRVALADLQAYIDRLRAEGGAGDEPPAA
jgi:excisionase family DNA binding protein